MKFSYTLLKQYLPELKNKQQLIDALNMHAFETEDAGGKTIDVFLPPNRYSDAASHIGIAREIAAILKHHHTNIPNISYRLTKQHIPRAFKILVEDKKLCPRYCAQLFENVRVKQSPVWMQKILKENGLRSVNNVVDVINYVMLETGQPLHAFDADKLTDSRIVVRSAERREKITSIEGIEYVLTPETLIIADGKQPIAIAGIKGDIDTEVTKNTKRILVEAANFDGVSIYKTAKRLHLDTDASQRFSHNMHPELARIGLARVAVVLQDVVGAHPSELYDTAPKKSAMRTLSFDINWFNSFIGTNMRARDAYASLRRLGFGVNGNKISIPLLRQDIETQEDLAEEIARLSGYNELVSQPPIVHLSPPEHDNWFPFRRMVRDILSGLGFDEVYNTSFVGSGDTSLVELSNPISEEKQYLRGNLAYSLLENIRENLKYYDEVRLFEVGHVFSKKEEYRMLGIAIGTTQNDYFFELKGVVTSLLQGLGLTDFDFMVQEDDGAAVTVRVDGKHIGELRRLDDRRSIVELHMDVLREVVSGELSYEPFPKYPAVMRDISFLVSPQARIGDIVRAMQLVNTHLIQDIDLIDEYTGADVNRQSITVRVRFRANDHTLNTAEVDAEMERIIKLLQDSFDAEIR